MRVLAIDPGETCGLAVVDNEFGILYHNAVPLEYASGDIISQLMTSSPSHIIVEMPPQHISGARGSWEKILQILERVFDKHSISKVLPGQWKPLSSILRQGTEHYETQHEKDAVCIARYFLRQAENPSPPDHPPTHRKGYTKRAKVGRDE